MDNRFTDIRSEGYENLLKALEIASTGHSFARYWIMDTRDGVNRLVLSASSNPGIGWNPFPAPSDCETVLPTILNWLGQVSYGTPPDHDGDSVKGWHVYSDKYGYVDPYGSCAYVAIEPLWACYGK